MSSCSTLFTFVVQGVSCVSKGPAEKKLLDVQLLLLAWQRYSSREYTTLMAKKFVHTFLTLLVFGVPWPNSSRTLLSYLDCPVLRI